MRSPVQKAVLPPLKFEGLRPINLQVYDFLREIIVDTTLKPGAAFTENDVSSQLKISRQPVRDALMRLSRDGLINVVPQSGCRVARICSDNLQEICFLRATLETAAVRRLPELDAVSRDRLFAAFDDNLTRQRGCLSEAPETVMKRFSRLDDGFHELICACSGFNGLTWQTIQDLKANVDRIRYRSCPDPGRQIRWHPGVL